MSTEPLRFPSTDGTALEAELRAIADAPVAVVLCHPHPQYGGSMRAGLIGDLFRDLPDRGLTALRFNFRGVEGSDGAWDEGRAERGDVAAAVDTLAARVPDATPLVLVGWSFGADMALSVRTDRLAGWCAIAPPLWFADAPEVTGSDPRPKHLVLGERDDVVSADLVAEVTTDWVATTVEVIPGATHFFLGKSAAVLDTVLGFCLDTGR